MNAVDALLAETRKGAAVPLHSTPELVSKVAEQRDKENRKREKKNQELIPELPDFTPLSETAETGEVATTPWQLLHVLARATALSGHDPSRVLARHWDCLRYIAALQSAHRGLELSAEGDDKRFYSKNTQAKDLGSAFGLAAAHHVMQRRHPGHHFDVVDAEVALEAGWVLRGSGRNRPELTKTRPKYFLVGQQPGSPVLAACVESRGSHSGSDAQHLQLATGAAPLPLVAVGDTGSPLSGFATSTALAAPSGIETRVLPLAGTEALAPAHDSAEPAAPFQENFFPGVPRTEADGKDDRRPGFHVPEHNRSWFAHALSRTAAASLLTFAGDRDSAAELLTERQRERLGAERSPGSTGMNCDVTAELGGVEFVGTDHVFRFNRVRVEAFSGIHQRLYRHLRQRDLAGYARERPVALREWADNRQQAEHDWAGVLNVDSAGSILAITVLPETGSLLHAPST